MTQIIQECTPTHREESVPIQAGDTVMEAKGVQVAEQSSGESEPHQPRERQSPLTSKSG